MAVSLRYFLDGLRALGEEPDYEPEIDDKDKEKDKSLRCTQARLSIGLAPCMHGDQVAQDIGTPCTTAGRHSRCNQAPSERLF